MKQTQQEPIPLFRLVYTASDSTTRAKEKTRSKRKNIYSIAKRNGIKD